jgi:hypothetical protein
MVAQPNCWLRIVDGSTATSSWPLSGEGPPVGAQVEGRRGKRVPRGYDTRPCSKWVWEYFANGNLGLEIVAVMAGYVNTTQRLLHGTNILRWWRDMWTTWWNGNVFARMISSVEFSLFFKLLVEFEDWSLISMSLLLFLVHSIRFFWSLMASSMICLAVCLWVW